jgi:hypothetical protein
MAYLVWNALVITDAANYTAKQVKKLLNEFRTEHPNHDGLKKRSNKSTLMSGPFMLCAIGGV